MHYLKIYTKDDNLFKVTVFPIRFSFVLAWMEKVPINGTQKIVAIVAQSAPVQSSSFFLSIQTTEIKSYMYLYLSFSCVYYKIKHASHL